MQVTKTTIHVSAALAALWLTACGGGGGGDPAPAPTKVAFQTAAAAPMAAPDPAAADALAWTTSSLAEQSFHWVASSADGQILAAGSLPGTLSVSTDGGATWTAASGVPANERWIGIDMTASGAAMVAVSYGGAMYRSDDSGATWTPIDVSFNAAGNLAYESVTISDDGQRIVAAVQNGNIYVSTDGGTSFATSAGAPVEYWRAVDSSADGMTVVAANHNGDVYLSTNGGVDFAPLAVIVDGANRAEGWYRLALSRDGNTLALATNQEWGAAGLPKSGIIIGQRTGANWTFTQGSNVSGNYGAIAMSANGDIISASLYAPTAPDGAPAQVLVSSNHGVSFAPVATPTASPANWRALATNADGSTLVLGNGNFNAGATGLLYTWTGIMY